MYLIFLGFVLPDQILFHTPEIVEEGVGHLRSYRKSTEALDLLTELHGLDKLHREAAPRFRSVLVNLTSCLDRNRLKLNVMDSQISLAERYREVAKRDRKFEI